MERKLPKPKKCKCCKEVFAPMRPIQSVCSPGCAYAEAKAQQEKKEAKVKAAKKKELMPKSEWVKLAQQVFNKFIRLRDQTKGCISCGTPLTGKYDAGHYFSQGAYPGLRFDEDNCFGQCVRCNQHLHGNISEYAIRLPARIGINEFEALKQRRGNVCKLSIPELQELINDYKTKLKQLT